MYFNQYDASSGLYLFNWSTKGLTSGPYRLYIALEMTSSTR